MAELTVYTEAVARNYRRFAAESVVIPVVKDNACGLGMEKMTELLREEGAELFACSTEEEALRLRDMGVETLLLSCVHGEEALSELMRRDVILSVESLAQAQTIDTLGGARVHLSVDTGFGRFGFLPCEVEEMKKVFSLPRVQVCGIFSHFRSAASAPGQFARFEGVLSALSGYPVGLRHIAATATALDPRYRLDAVRVGTGLVGRWDGLERSARLTARICSIRRLPRGSRVGYSGSLLRRDTDVAIVDAGTADGAFLTRRCGLRDLIRFFRQRVSVGSREASVLGTPGLTHTAIDVTGIPCHVGDRVEIAQTPALISPAVPRRYL